MPQVRIDVTWNPSSRKITVSPDPAHVYWGRKDTARWVLADDGGDKKARISALVFNSGGGKGPFGTLGPETGSGEKRWDGGALKHENGRFKYAVTVASGSSSETLDPEVITGEKP